MSVKTSDLQILADLANKIRMHSVVATSASNSGHPTSCSSCAEILSVLFFHTMRYKIWNHRDASSDRFVLSKGHAAPALYAAWCEAGVVPKEDLKTYMQFGSDLEGTPTPRLTFIDIATGSLGQGLSVAAGMAYVGKYIDKAAYRIFCLMGDKETSEGSVWEALNFSTAHKLDNLCLIIDANENDICPVEVLRKRIDSFGFHVEIIDGHNITELIYGFRVSNAICGRPTALIAKTVKGKNFYGIADVKIWNERPLGKLSELNLKHLESLLVTKQNLKPCISQPHHDVPDVCITNIIMNPGPNYKKNEKESTLIAYGNALVKLAKNNGRIVALGGDAEKLKQTFQERFIECAVSEQNLVGISVGAACRERCIPIASTFAAFFTKAHDQIRMSAVSQTNAKFVGTHCGVSVGEAGPCLMALEDLALFRTIPECTIFYPSDAVSTERAVELAANIKGMVYIRLTKPPTTVIYSNEQSFEVGKSMIVNTQSENDAVLVITAGVLLQEALKASELLETPIRIMDIFSVKPLDVDGILKNAKECNGKILVIEDHYAAGGIGEAVASLVSKGGNLILKHVSVPRIPRSGRTDLLLDHYGLSARHIVKYVEELCCFN